MKFSIVIGSDPFATQSGVTALQLCRAIIAANHQVYRIFFFQQGVLQANSYSRVEGSECDLHAEWQQLATTHKIDMVACVASALKRGILDQQEAKQASSNLSNACVLGGLGQYIDAVLNSDRVIHL